MRTKRLLQNPKKIAKRYGDVKRPDMDSTRGQALVLHPNGSNMIKCDPLGGSDRKAKTSIAIVYPTVISIVCIILHENYMSMITYPFKLQAYDPKYEVQSCS